MKRRGTGTGKGRGRGRGRVPTELAILAWVLIYGELVRPEFGDKTTEDDFEIIVDFTCPRSD